MKRLCMALAGAALLCAGCPVTSEVSSPDWKAYGKVKADFALNSNGATEDDSGYFVQYVGAADADGTFAMTAIDSRFGANLDMGAVTGKVEVDFHGMNVLLRHAYVKLDLGNDMSLLAGQASDVFSPLFPGMLNWYVGWYAGNLGHRSPQFRWEWAPAGGAVDVQVALSDTQDTLIGLPDIQARGGFKIKDNLKLGASIVMGSTDLDDDETEEDIFGLAVDVDAKLGDNLSIKGEWYTGKNLSGYMGNIGVPGFYNPPGPGGDCQGEIGGDGLWVAVVLKPTDNVTANIGYMFDSNDDADITDGTRADNSCIFGNAIFKLNDNTDFGIEISKWETEYKNDAAYDNLRIQGSVIVKF